jgi:hypothetical protein
MSQADKIRSINDPGWDGVDADSEPIRLKNMDLQRDMDIQFHRCFTTEAGKNRHGCRELMLLLVTHEKVRTA